MSESFREIFRDSQELEDLVNPVAPPLAYPVSDFADVAFYLQREDCQATVPVAQFLDMVAKPEEYRKMNDEFMEELLTDKGAKADLTFWQKVFLDLGIMFAGSVLLSIPMFLLISVIVDA